MSIVRTCLVLIFFLSLNGCASSHFDSFYIENVKFSESDTHDNLRGAVSRGERPPVPDAFILTGHRIVRGDGTIIAFREFSPGPLLTVDQGGFRKVSILLPGPALRIGETRMTKTSAAVAFVTVGNPSSPDRGCWAYSSDGDVKVNTNHDGSASITIDLQFGKLLPNCSEFRLLKTFTVRRKDLKNLTPWDGAVGSSIYEEGIRP